jgi:NADH:ubiquinone oxidoreductase subunit F (NADH-binding)
VNNSYIFISNNDEELYNLFINELRSKNIKENYNVRLMNTFGLYSYSSNMYIYPENIRYVNFKKDDIPELIDTHFVNGKIAEKFLYKPESKPYLKIGELIFYHKQLRIVLRNSGIVDPECIESYFTRNGYRALAKALESMSPDEVLNEVKKSGLRGRGGAGFPTWMKWNFTKQVESKIKYVICNADEGDPGAYMDRSVLESDPHSVIEGMLLAAYTAGCSRGYIYIRAEYPLAIRRLEKAISDAQDRGLLGDKILGTDFSFKLELRFGAGAFVCGEETALLASAEGKRGMPRPRPPFPATKGLWKEPTVINNVETFANIPFIILKGGSWYSKIGTGLSTGTKVFALTGKIKKSGLVEVPMGVTLREIIFDAGNGIIKDKKIKAVQTGGPSGGVIPVEYLDTPISYESLGKLGSIMGSGGMIVMDETDCMIDVSKFYLQFSVDESCGKCSPCRIGGKQMLELMTEISEGRGSSPTLEKLNRISSAMQKASLCGLGQSAPNPIVSTIKYFNEEYREHIENKKCRSGVCKALIVYSIDKINCIGCHLCAIRCPVNCISGNKKEVHVIDQTRCIKCGMCFDSCKFNAVTVS